MKISVTDAKAQLTELVRRAEAGDEIILTRHGQPAVRLTPITRKMSREEKRAVLDEIMKSAAGKATPGPDAARSQDFFTTRSACRNDGRGYFGVVGNDFSRTDIEPALTSKARPRGSAPWNPAKG